MSLEDWKIFKDGFLHLNHYFRPEDLVEIKTCALGDGVTSALAPGSQKVFFHEKRIMMFIENRLLFAQTKLLTKKNSTQI